MKDAKETKPEQLLGPGGRQQRSSLCKGSFKGEGLGGGCACRCSSWDRMLTTMPAKRRQRRPRWSERARAHAPRCAGGRAACGGPAARTLSGLRMGRGSNEKEREAAQGWPAPKSEQKVTWAAPNGCSYTVFAPARLTACPSTRDHLVPMKERIKAHRTATGSPTWLRRRRCHDSNSHIFIGGQRKRGRNEAYNVIDETSENWVDMDYDA